MVFIKNSSFLQIRFDFQCFCIYMYIDFFSTGNEVHNQSQCFVLPNEAAKV